MTDPEDDIFIEPQGTDGDELDAYRGYLGGSDD